MIKRWRLKISNSLIAWVGVLGVGMLPCPDCGIPMAAHIWPVAAVVWLWRSWRRRGERQLDLVLSRESRDQAMTSLRDPADSVDA
jgi:hypothetical protein